MPRESLTRTSNRTWRRCSRREAQGRRGPPPLCSDRQPVGARRPRRRR
jgi:hypothetical protein